MNETAQTERFSH